jgi:16S rRNA U1498 N3-methylase RsmE
MEVGGVMRPAEFDSRVIIADAEGPVDPPAIDEEVVLAVGPEGGFEKGEAAAAGGSMSLGHRTLRIETAALVGAATLLRSMGRWKEYRDHPQ